MSSRRETAWLERALPPTVLFVAGMAVIPAFLLQSSLVLKAVQAAVFFLLVLVTRTSSGSRVAVTCLVLLTSTTVFNLLSPFGEVLWKLGPLRITEGALRTGLFKGLTLVGLLLLSRLAVRRSMVLPGRIGLYVSTTLVYLSRMLEKRKRREGSSLISRLDDLFLSVYRDGPPPRPEIRQKPAVVGIAAVFAFVASNWILVFFPL